MVETIETVVIGAGTSGLATSYILKQKGREHVVLEKTARAGNTWRTRRWDSFCLVTPNWTFRLPGWEYDGPDPHGFILRDEICARVEQYAEKNDLPVSYNTPVASIAPEEGGGFRVRADGKEYRARNVVAANGYFSEEKIPEFAAQIPASILQMHTIDYRNPQALPDGAVLVVGSAQSGAQIAEELYQSGRKVYLATGVAPHAPRHYRGRDAFDWLIESGFLSRPKEQMAVGGRMFVGPMVSGKGGGRSLNLHQFYHDGVVLLGHARGYVDGKLILASDLKENVGKADGAQKMFLEFIDTYIQREGIDAPQERYAPRMDAYQAADIPELDLDAEGIRTIIWGCGYRYDTRMFQMPVLMQMGLPDTVKTESRLYPGLFFVGFPFQPNLTSAFLLGIAQPAAETAETIAARAVG